MINFQMISSFFQERGFIYSGLTTISLIPYCLKIIHSDWIGEWRIDFLSDGFNYVGYSCFHLPTKQAWYLTGDIRLSYYTFAEEAKNLINDLQ